MGLTLCVFSSDPGEGDELEEIAECSVGHYSDFGYFRDTIARHLGSSRFPTLMEHSDCEGEWSLDEIPTLERELLDIGSAFQKLPPEGPVGAFEHTVEYRRAAGSLYDCFHTVDGENLFEALIDLCGVAKAHRRHIDFQ